MSESVSTSHLPASAARRPDRSFVLLLTPLAALSVPSLLFCALLLVLRLHGSSGEPIDLHLPAQTPWDHVFALEVSAYDFVARWNSLATLAATAFFVSTMVLQRWRNYLVLALIPYGLLICADFTLRWRTALLP